MSVCQCNVLVSVCLSVCDSWLPNIIHGVLLLMPSLHVHYVFIAVLQLMVSSVQLIHSLVFFTQSLSVLFSCVHLRWPWKQRLVWLSTASDEPSFRSSPMHNPACVLGCLYVWVVCSYCHTDSACLVSVRALYCIFIVPSPAASLSRC